MGARSRPDYANVNLERSICIDSRAYKTIISDMILRLLSMGVTGGGESVEMKKERGSRWHARWLGRADVVGAMRTGAAEVADGEQVTAAPAVADRPGDLRSADAGRVRSAARWMAWPARSGVGWAVLRPSDVVRREFWLEETALRADPGVMRFEALQHLGSAASDVAWNVRAGVPLGGRVRVELRSVAVRQAERACEQLEAAGVGPERLLDPADVLEAAWRESWESATVEPGLILFLGEQESVLIWLDGAARRVRNLALGVRSVVEEVAGRRAGAGRQSERGASPADRLEVARDEEVAATLAARAHLEVSRLFTTAGIQTADQPARPVGVWVCGEPASAPAFVATLASRLGLPVHAWEASLGDAEWWTEPPVARRQEWTAYVGGVLRLWRRRREDEAIDACFLPPVRSGRLARRFAHATLMGAAALVTLGAIPPALHYHHLAKDMADRVRRLDEEVQRLQRIDTENRAALHRLSAERSRVEALHELASARLRWPRFLGGLEQCLEEVEDAWLDGLHPAGDAATRSSGALHVRVTGCLLASETGPQSGALDELEAEPRVQALLAQVARLPSIERIERERFARTEPGLLRFDLELALAEEALR